MAGFRHITIAAALLASGAAAQSADDAPWRIVPGEAPGQPSSASAAEFAPLDLTGDRPRLSMTLPLGRRSSATEAGDPGSPFSWSLRAWQLNTASLAHIQCSQGMLTINSYVAQDCRFVDQPLPRDSVSLVQVSGDWMAAPGLRLGMSAFRSDAPTPAPQWSGEPLAFSLLPDALSAGDMPLSRQGTTEGLDFNVSFGIQTERIGDFLVGLQLARYRQRMSLADLGMPTGTVGLDDSRYGNSAQLLLGWRHGDFSGEMLGQHRDVPMWLGGDVAPGTLNSFDLEFSWQALRNASLSIGVSNVMDSAPRADEPKADVRLEDPLESVYGRIPYVRYKHDL